MKNFIFLILSFLLTAQNWNYTADILEKSNENDREVRIFKSNKIGNKQVVIYKDTISIYTNQAKQYIDTKELHLIGPVTMINGQDSLQCKNMIFWYEIDSLHAFGDVNFKFKENFLETDSLMYVQTGGYRGYSFVANNKAKFIDPEYSIEAQTIKYNDITQRMILKNNVVLKSKNQGANGNFIDLLFQDSLINEMFINNDAYIYNNHYAKVNQGSFQLFKDEINGNQIKANFNGKNLDKIHVKGMAESKYYVVNDSTFLMGFNEATGDTMRFQYDDIQNIEQILISGDARGLFSPEKGKTKLDSTLIYQSNKINYKIKEQITYLEDEVKITYQNTELSSSLVDVDWKNNMLYAHSKDSSSARIVSQNQKPMMGDKLEFDLINKKGIINLGETTVRDGIYKSKTIFREDPNIYHMNKSIYTTCEHEHPHYYFRSPKMKMIQGERIITKPLFLYIFDVPIIGLPFAILPSTSGGRQSGWIMPSFGVSNSSGTFFQKLGYYWAPNDYLDSKILMDFYDEDRIELNSSLRYVKRYKYSGNISSTYKRKLNESNDISDLFSNKSIENFDIKWLHNQQIDNTQNFNVNWIYVTSSDFYNDSYDLNTRTQQKLESSAAYSKVWSAYNNRLSISLSESYDLNKESEIPNCINIDEDGYCQEEQVFYRSRVLPNLRFSHSNSKLFGQGDRWYNSIYFNMSSQYKGFQKIGSIYKGGTLDNDNFDSEVSDTLRFDNSFKHSLNFSMPLKLFNWLNINPSLNLNEGWIFRYNYNGFEREGFKRRLTGGFNLSSSTTIYGLFELNKFNINSIRHILTPTLSLNYTPNFSKPVLGIDLGYFNDDQNPNTNDDYFNNSMIGSTPTNEIRKINLNLSNNFQMKLNDSIQTKIDFLRWNISTGYNFMADEFKLDLIKSRINYSPNETFDFDFTMYNEPYKLDENLNRINQYASFPTLTYLQGSTDISLFGNKKITANENIEIDTLNRDQESQLYNSNKFFDPGISNNTIWELDLRLGAKLQKTIIDNDIGWDKTLWVQPILKLNLTEKWKMTYAGQIDIINSQIVSHNMYFYRTLHCWEFGFKWWPTGAGSGFLLNIRVKSPDLKDIKLKSSGGRLFGL